eukprot:5065301-Prymnesium_polylepis.1
MCAVSASDGCVSFQGRPFVCRAGAVENACPTQCHVNPADHAADSLCAHHHCVSFAGQLSTCGVCPDSPTC